MPIAAPEMSRVYSLLDGPYHTAEFPWHGINASVNTTSESTYVHSTSEGTELRGFYIDVGPVEQGQMLHFKSEINAGPSFGSIQIELVGAFEDDKSVSPPRDFTFDLPIELNVSLRVPQLEEDSSTVRLRLVSREPKATTSEIVVYRAAVVTESDAPVFFSYTPPFVFRGQEVAPVADGAPGSYKSYFEYIEDEDYEPEADWNSDTQRRYRLGVDRGMLYLDGVGHTWSGLVSVNREEAEGDVDKRYLDGRLFRVGVPTEDYMAILSAYTYPDEFEPCIGILRPDGNALQAYGQESRSFSLCYRTYLGSGDSPTKHYTLHFIYDAMAIPAGVENETMNDSTEIQPFEFQIHGIPVDVEGVKPTSYFAISSRDVLRGTLSSIERSLYGDDGVTPKLPTIEELRAYLVEYS